MTRPCRRPARGSPEPPEPNGTRFSQTSVADPYSTRMTRRCLRSQIRERCSSQACQFHLEPRPQACPVSQVMPPGCEPGRSRSWVPSAEESSDDVHGTDTCPSRRVSMSRAKFRTSGRRKQSAVGSWGSHLLENGQRWMMLPHSLARQEDSGSREESRHLDSVSPLSRYGPAKASTSARNPIVQS